MMKRILLLTPVLMLPFADNSPRPLNACAPAPPRDMVVEIASESAIIIWDEKNKTQHFIRRATFATSAKGGAKVSDFGFLVPTPTRPKIVEAEDKAFDLLAEITAPKTETHSRPKGDGGCGCGSMARKEAYDAVPGASVHVLEENRVGNLDYKVLQAANAQALTDWLNERAYEIRPALTRWLEQYVTKGWIITAFKVAKDEKSEGAATKAVCMSFETDKPFFPYREPDDMHEAKGKRLLRVFFIGEGKAYGLHGASNWVGKIVWANRPTDEQWQGVLPKLNQPELDLSNWWLTEFEDPSSPRPGNNDVTFITKGSDQNPVERPPIIIYTSSNSNGALPTYLGLAAIVACLCVVRMARMVSSRTPR
jgi:Uncharacterized protein conserved in bacteria (DUF2330)